MTDESQRLIREAVSSHLIGLLHRLDANEIAKNNGANVADNYSLRLELAADFYSEENDYQLVVSLDLMGPAMSIIGDHQVMLESVSVAGIGEDTGSIATAIKEVLIPDLTELVHQWPHL